MNNQALTGLAGHSAVTATVAPELSQIHSQLADLVDGLQKSACAIENALDRIHGGKPEGVANAKDAGPQPTNALSLIRETLRRGNAVESVLSDLAARINTLD